MKKWLILFVIAVSLWWGYQEGNDSAKNARPPQENTAASPTVSSSSLEPDAILGQAKELYGKLISQLSHDAESVPSPIPSEEKEDSLLDRANNIYDFPSSLEARVDRKHFVPLKDIPLLMQQALIAAEDKRFYEHGAIDLMGVARAAYVNYQAGTTVEGGSTIGQQTVKNIFLSNERTFMRKGEELLLAIQLERHYTKNQILELYLNTIYFGHGAYGIGQASRVYFGKKPEDLTTGQCALLAGLPQAPTAYDPIDHPEAARGRQRTVLALMAQQNLITRGEAAEAAAAGLELRES